MKLSPPIFYGRKLILISLKKLILQMLLLKHMSIKSILKKKEKFISQILGIIFFFKKMYILLLRVWKTYNFVYLVSSYILLFFVNLSIYFHQIQHLEMVLFTGRSILYSKLHLLNANFNFVSF